MSPKAATKPQAEKKGENRYLKVSQAIRYIKTLRGKTFHLQNLHAVLDKALLEVESGKMSPADFAKVIEADEDARTKAELALGGPLFPTGESRILPEDSPEIVPEKE